MAGSRSTTSASTCATGLHLVSRMAIVAALRGLSLSLRGKSPVDMSGRWGRALLSTETHQMEFTFVTTEDSAPRYGLTPSFGIILTGEHGQTASLGRQE